MCVACKRALLALVAFVAGLGAGCEGYADLPLALRERGELTVGTVIRYPTGPSRVEVTLAPPADALGPFVVVGNPTALSAGARVVSWAVGSCAGEAPSGSGPLKLCLAVGFGASRAEAPLAVALVVESRGDGRRFTLLGEEAP